jgi:type II secretory pathway pseudopilin PulG
MKTVVKTRRGLTLLEIVISIGVFALLAAVLVPAVQQVRAVARSTECASNLHQIGVALEGHVGVRGHFPDGCGWVRALMPHLGESAVYAAMKSGDRASAAAWPAGLALPRVDVMLCSADNHNSFPEDSLNYAANMGSGPQIHGINGLFSSLVDPLVVLFLPNAPNPRHRLTRPADVTDGLSNTAAFSEFVVANPSTQPADDRRVIWDLVPSLAASHEYSEFRRRCLAPRQHGLHMTTQDRGVAWASQSWSYLLATYHHSLPPNAPSCKNAGFDVYSAGSQHEDGAWTMYGDGRTTFTSNSIDQSVWSDLGSRSQR